MAPKKVMHEKVEAKQVLTAVLLADSFTQVRKDQKCSWSPIPINLSMGVVLKLQQQRSDSTSSINSPDPQQLCIALIHALKSNNVQT
jgi:hypothetical protein